MPFHRSILPGSSDVAKHRETGPISIFWGTTNIYLIERRAKNIAEGFLDGKEAFALISTNSGKFDLMTGSTGGSTHLLLIWLVKVSQ